jgi:hypothetical protein
MRRPSLILVVMGASLLAVAGSSAFTTAARSVSVRAGDAPTGIF